MFNMFKKVNLVKCGPMFCSARNVAEWNNCTCNRSMAPLTLKTDYADIVYIAANLAGNGTESWIVDKMPFVTIGDFTYALTQRGELCMFPYTRVKGEHSDGPVYNRTLWNYGVYLSKEFIRANRDMFAKDDKPGFPWFTLISHMQDMHDMCGMMDELGIKTETE